MVTDVALKQHSGKFQLLSILMHRHEHLARVPKKKGKSTTRTADGGITHDAPLAV